MRTWSLGPWRKDVQVLLLQRLPLRGRPIRAPSVVSGAGVGELQVPVLQSIGTVLVPALQDLLLRRSREAQRVQVREEQAHSVPQVQLRYVDHERPEHVDESAQVWPPAGLR